MNLVNPDFWNALTEKQKNIIHICSVKHRFVDGTEAFFNENITLYQVFKTKACNLGSIFYGCVKRLKKESEAFLMESMQTNGDTEQFFSSFLEYKPFSGEYLRKFDDT